MKSRVVLGENVLIPIGVVIATIALFCGGASWVATISWFTYRNTQDITSHSENQDRFTRSVARIENEMVRIRTILEQRGEIHGPSGSEQSDDDEPTVSGIPSEGFSDLQRRIQSARIEDQSNGRVQEFSAPERSI